MSLLTGRDSNVPPMDLLFIHGAGSNRDMWREQQKAFPDAHYPNLPGHTSARDGSRGEGKRTISEYADWVERYAHIAKLERVAVVGHSMGGAVALELALRGQRWLAALVLTGTGAHLPVDPELVRLLRDDYPAAVEYVVERSFAPREQPTYAERLRTNGTRRQMARTPQAVTLGDYLASAEFDVSGRLGEIRVPTLCIVGSDDLLTPPAYSEQLHRGIRGSTLVTVPDAGHMLPLEKPLQYNSAIEFFLARNK